MQTEITSNNKLVSDLVDDTNQTNKFVTESQKTRWNERTDIASSGHLGVIDANTTYRITTTSDGKLCALDCNYENYQAAGVNAFIGKGTLENVLTAKNYQGKIDSSNKLSSDLVDDTEATNKFVTANDKTNWNGKQEELVSGTNIKTINNESLLGSGNITIQGGGGSSTDVQINGTSIVSNNVANILTKTAYDASTNKVVTESDLPDISGKQDEIDSSHKLSADLVDDTSTTNKFVTASDKTTWNGKQDALVSGTNIRTVNGTSLLGAGNLVVPSSKIYYGSTNTLSSSTAKTVTCSDFVLEKGAVINVRVLGLSTTNIASLNVNSTGVINVSYKNNGNNLSYYPSSHYALGDVVSFVYDGSNYIPLEPGNATDSKAGVTMLHNSTSSNPQDKAATPYLVTQYLNYKQDTLVSGSNIKTINNESILGSGNITIETEPDTRVVVPETTSFGNMSTATQSSRTDLGTFWVTSSNSSMAKIRGKKLNSITLKTDTAGTLTMRGYDSDIDGHLDNNALNLAAQTANQNGYDICTINLVLGEATYLFDGTDNRVTIISQSAINHCPNIIGFVKSGDTAIFKYNNDGFSADDFVHFVWYRSSTPNYSKASSLALNINYNELEDVAPEAIGTMKLFAGTVIPNTWLLCDGSAVSRATYTDLFNVIGTTYGSGDGSTTFNLPDMRGNVPVGYKSGDTDFGTLGNTGGEKTHTLTVNEMPSHNHKLPINVGGSSTLECVNYMGGQSSAQFYVDSQSVGGNQPHNNLQPHLVVNYIIKATGTKGTIASEEAEVIDNLTSTSSTDALSANQGRILNEKLNNYILVKLTANQNNSTTGVDTIVKFDITDFSKGSLFTLQSDGGVKVGEACDIEINAVLRYGYSNSAKKETSLYINSTNVLTLAVQTATATTHSIPSYLTHVNANDVIYLKGLFTEISSFVYTGTYLMIKKIG